MLRWSLFLASAIMATCPVSAQAGERNLFAGLDLSIGTASGSSDTTDGGAPFAGGGVVSDVNFGTTTGIGGHVGYKLDSATSLSVGYRHVRGDIDWRADFPLYGVASDFEGSAVSDTIMAKLAYERLLSSAVAVRAAAGAGISINRLSGLVETDEATGVFLSDVAGHSRTSPAAEVGAGLRYRILPNAVLGLDASFAYTGGFATGDTRSGNLGITDINPYRIDDVWRTNFGASISLAF